MIKLTMSYSTLAERVGNIKPPPERLDWRVTVIIQNPNNIAWRGEGLAELMIRTDLDIHELTNYGVAKSRNQAIWQSKGEYLIFSDDDILFHEEGLDEAIRFMDDNPQYSLLLGQAVDPDGKLRKRYPKNREELTEYNSARAATYEMIIRVEAVRQLGVWFDEKFGAGAKNYLGDEYIFIVDLLSAGGRAVFMPITLATHPFESSGSRWGSKKDRMARASVFDRVFGSKAPLVRFGFGVRRIKELGGPLKFLLFVFGR